MSRSSASAGRESVASRPAVALPSVRSIGGRRTAWGILLLAALGWAAAFGGVLGEDLVNGDGWPLVRRFFAAMVRPALGADVLRLALDAAMTTLSFAVCGTALSLLLGTVGGVLGSEVWWRTARPGRGGLGGHRAPWLVVRAVLAVPRAIHEIVWGLLFLATIGLDPVVGILAIAIPFGAITAKVFSELLDEAPRESLAGLRAAGVPPLRAVLYSTVPQTFPDLVSYAFYRFECSIRSAAVLGIIGAGGLGYEIFLSLQSLRYEQVWTFLWALVALTGLADLWSALVRHRIGGRGGPDAGAGTPGTSRRVGFGLDRVVRASLGTALGLLAVSIAYVDADFGRVVSADTVGRVAAIAADALPPSLGGLGVWDLARLSGKTLAMSILAVAGAAVGGILLSFPAASTLALGDGGRDARRGPVATLLRGATFVTARSALLLTRAVPAPIWALVFLFVLFPGILPGALALGVYTLGVLGRLMAEANENLDPRPVRALRSQGASALQAFLYGVVPTVLPRFMSYILYRWEVCIRATVMVGLVGAGGLGRLLTEQLTSFDYAAVAATLLCYVLLTWGVDQLSAAVRRDLR